MRGKINMLVHQSLIEYENIPQADVERQAIDSLRGYVYQIYAAALAWLDIDKSSKIFLEVAEDYAIVAQDAIKAVQVKDTVASTKVTLNTASVQDAISNFIKLVESNTSTNVFLRYFTTSEIGVEKALLDRPDGIAGLLYWQKAAISSDVEPLRRLLVSNKFPENVREFVRCRSNEELRKDLLRKIHWDCGNPDLKTLQQEFHDRLVSVCRDTFNIPATDVSQISDILTLHVLRKSIVATPVDRVLTSADLHLIIDKASRISIKKNTFETMIQSLSLLVPQLNNGINDNLTVNFTSPTWMIKSADLPINNHMVQRSELEKNILNNLEKYGVTFLVGASGVGKSFVARSVVEQLTSNFVIIDFRDANIDETKAILNSLLSKLGGLNSEFIIFEDLNYLNEPALKLLIMQIFKAIGRRYISAIVTLYQEPALKTLSNFDFDQRSIVSCPYFTEDETSKLVQLFGGEPSVWGKLCHISGGHGHPQLVYAFICGVASRGWVRSEISAIIETGLSSGDIVLERESARKSLMSALRDDSRELLYRLSLFIGNFNRFSAMQIALLSPSINRSGEAFDSVTGSWIEKIGQDNYRISPLIASSGKDMLSPVLQEEINSKIADQLISQKSIDVTDITRIILHAMLGKNEKVLFIISSKFISADEKLINSLAESSSIIGLFDLSKPIYPNNMYISLLLRLAQFKILMVTPKSGKITECIDVLRKELDLCDSKNHKEIQALVFLGILNNMGIANYIDDWVELLLKLPEVFASLSFPFELSSDIQNISGNNGDIAALFFAIGSAKLTTIENLQKVLKQLDQLQPTQRMMLLQAIKDFSLDYSVLINSSWSSQSKKQLDAEDASHRYKQMAKMTQDWGVRSITVQCWIASAIMIDEYAHDQNRALQVLDDAIVEVGPDILISRAKAKIFFNAKDYPNALAIMRKIADQIGSESYIERAFALREAAISAANCNEWLLAEKWFLESQKVAELIDLPNMRIMAIGLGADAAVAAFNIGEVKRTLQSLVVTLTNLSNILPESSLQASYCHHMVRHTILWIKAQLEGWSELPNGEAIVMKPGICSDIEPSKEISERPLAALEIAWYLLADCEFKSRKNTGIAKALDKRLINGRILPMELGFRLQYLWREINTINVEGFSNYLMDYIELRSYLSEHELEIKKENDLLNPKYINIPKLSPIELNQSHREYVDDAIMAFIIVAACKNASEILVSLRQTLSKNLDRKILNDEILLRVVIDDPKCAPISFIQMLVDSAMLFRSNIHVIPQNYCIAGLRFLLQAWQSLYKSELIAVIAIWQRKAWTRILESEKFQLILPQIFEPEIYRVLSNLENDEKFLGSLLLVTADATGLNLSQDLRNNLKVLAIKI